MHMFAHYRNGINASRENVAQFQNARFKRRQWGFFSNNNHLDTTDILTGALNGNKSWGGSGEFWKYYGSSWSGNDLFDPEGRRYGRSSCKLGPCGGECPKGYYKFQVFLDDQTYRKHDYHWYRQDSDGRWLHKLGMGGENTRNDSNNQQLVCPANQPRSYEVGRIYDKLCATLCVPG